MPPSTFITSGVGATSLPAALGFSGPENLSAFNSSAFNYLPTIKINPIVNAAFYTYTTTAVALTATAFQSYRAITSAFTITLPKLRVNQWVVVARDQTAGTTTVGRNSQTIDGVSGDFTMDTNKIIMLFICTSTDTLVTRLVGNLPT